MNSIIENFLKLLNTMDDDNAITVARAIEILYSYTNASDFELDNIKDDDVYPKMIEKIIGHFKK